MGPVVLVRPMLPSDAADVLAVQRAAFTIEAELYGDPGLPPLLESHANLNSWLDAGGIGFIAASDGRLVGSIRIESDGDCVLISRLSVAPDCQRKGVGEALLRHAESATPAVTARLFTGHLSAGNLRLYARLGYTEERRQQVDAKVTLVHLRKDLRPSD